MTQRKWTLVAWALAVGVLCGSPALADDAKKAAKDTYDREGKNASGDKQRDEAKKRDDAIAKAENDYKKNVRDTYEAASDRYERVSAIRWVWRRGGSTPSCSA